MKANFGTEEGEAASVGDLTNSEIKNDRPSNTSTDL